MADKFGDQRCFFDRRCCPHPLAGWRTSMNTGLQDAYNLAWKLAGVVNGQVEGTRIG